MFDFTTNHRFVGATVRATNDTYGLTPSREMGDEEIVKSIIPYDGTILTDKGNCYLAGGYRIMRFAN